MDEYKSFSFRDLKVRDLFLTDNMSTVSWFLDVVEAAQNP
jgi:hypothetical protein